MLITSHTQFQWNDTHSKTRALHPDKIFNLPTKEIKLISSLLQKGCQDSGVKSIKKKLKTHSLKSDDVSNLFVTKEIKERKNIQRLVARNLRIQYGDTMLYVIFSRKATVRIGIRHSCVFAAFEIDFVVTLAIIRGFRCCNVLCNHHRGMVSRLILFVNHIKFVHYDCDNIHIFAKSMLKYCFGFVLLDLIVFS